MRAKIKGRKEIAEGTIEVTFDLLGRKINFKSGQFFYITLINPPYHDDKGARRHFTIVNSPNESNIIVMTTRVRDSAFKKSLNEMPVGTEVEIDDSAQGNFVLPSDTSKPLVMIAGGVGVTPYMSMLQYIKEENLPFRVTLIYSNKDKSSAAYFSKLQNMAGENPNIKIVFTMTQDPSWSGEKKRIDSDFIKEYIEDINKPVYYVSGPPQMVEAIKKSIKETGTSSDIKSENFIGY